MGQVLLLCSRSTRGHDDSGSPLDTFLSSRAHRTTDIKPLTPSCLTVDELSESRVTATDSPPWEEDVAYLSSVPLLTTSSAGAILAQSRYILLCHASIWSDMKGGKAYELNLPR